MCALLVELISSGYGKPVLNPGTKATTGRQDGSTANGHSGWQPNGWREGWSADGQPATDGARSDGSWSDGPWSNGAGSEGEVESPGQSADGRCLQRGIFM